LQSHIFSGQEKKNKQLLMIVPYAFNDCGWWWTKVFIDLF